MAWSLQNFIALNVKQGPKLALQFKILLDLLCSIEMNHLKHWHKSALVLLNTLEHLDKNYFLKQVSSCP